MVFKTIKWIIVSFILISLTFNAVAMNGTDLPKVLSLDSAIELAMQRNPDIKMQEQAIKVGHAQYIQTRGEWLLKMNLTMEQIHLDNSNALVTSGVSGDQSFATIDASQPVITFGKLGYSTRGAKAYFENQAVVLNSVKQSVRYGVKSAFYNVLLLQELVKVDQESLQIATEHLKNAQVRFNQGVNTLYDVTKAKVDVANRKSELITAENNLIKAHQSLNQLLHILPGTEFQIEGRLDYYNFQPSVEKAWNVARDNRPEIKSKKLIIDQYKSLLGLRKSQNFPVISVGGSYSWYRNEIEGYDTYNPKSWNSYIKLTLPIIEGMKTVGQIKEAQAYVKQSQFDYEKAMITAQTEVEQTVREIIKQQELVKTTREAVELADIALNMSKVAYDNGRVTTLDVSDSELSYRSAKVNYIQSIASYLTALAKLEQVIGKNELPQ
jgi:outer membrane protein